jgi:hypothetical protein
MQGRWRIESLVIRSKEEGVAAVNRRLRGGLFSEEEKGL